MYTQPHVIAQFKHDGSCKSRFIYGSTHAASRCGWHALQRLRSPSFHEQPMTAVCTCLLQVAHLCSKVLPLPQTTQPLPSLSAHFHPLSALCLEALVLAFAFVLVFILLVFVLVLLAFLLACALVFALDLAGSVTTSSSLALATLSALRASTNSFPRSSRNVHTFASVV